MIITIKTLYNHPTCLKIQSKLKLRKKFAKLFTITEKFLKKNILTT